MNPGKRKWPTTGDDMVPSDSEEEDQTDSEIEEDIAALVATLENIEQKLGDLVELCNQIKSLQSSKPL